MKLERVHLLSRPLFIMVEPTNRCNLNCVMCARPYYDKEKNVLGDMEMRTFERIIPFIKAAELVSLFGYGEPLIAKNFWSFLEICKNLGVTTAINTNGVMINENTAARLIEGKLNSLTISLDAAREDTFNSLRGYSLKKIVNNLKILKKLREGSFISNPEVGINFVLMKNNVQELIEMVDLAGEIGAARLTVTNMMIYSKSLDRSSAYHRVDEVELAFREAEKRAREKGLILVLPDFQKKFIECFQPFNTLFINWDGKVRPCCNAAFVSEKFSFPVGDLSKESLRKIWNNEHMVAIRKGLLGKGLLPPQCETCGFRIRNIQGHRRYLD